MRNMDQLPEWMDLGKSEDFTTPAISLAEQLKKKLNQPKSGSLGGSLGEMVDFDSGPMAMSAGKGGPKSL